MLSTCLLVVFFRSICSVCVASNNINFYKDSTLLWWYSLYRSFINKRLHLKLKTHRIIPYDIKYRPYFSHLHFTTNLLKSKLDAMLSLLIVGFAQPISEWRVFIPPILMIIIISKRILINFFWKKHSHYLAPIRLHTYLLMSLWLQINYSCIYK